MIKVKTEIKLKKAEITAIERHPVPVLGKDYRVKIIYKSIKIAELDVEDTTIKISLLCEFLFCELLFVFVVLILYLFLYFVNTFLKKYKIFVRSFNGYWP